MIDFTADRIRREVSALAVTPEIEAKIINILKDVFSTQVPLYPVEDIRDASFQLLIAIHARDSIFGPTFYSTDGAMLIRRRGYHALGSGALVDYILARFEKFPHLTGLRKILSVDEAVAAIEYMLQIATEYVDGVGGKSHIVVMKADGQIEEPVDWEIAEHENVHTRFEILGNHLMLDLFHANDSEFKAALREFRKEMSKLRRLKKGTDKKMADIEAWIALQSTNIK